jgi:hypothetical protein
LGAVVRNRTSDEEGAGQVLEQSVPAGKKVEKGSRILLAISSGRGDQQGSAPEPASDDKPRDGVEAGESGEPPDPEGYEGSGSGVGYGLSRARPEFRARCRTRDRGAVPPGRVAVDRTIFTRGFRAGDLFTEAGFTDPLIARTGVSCAVVARAVLAGAFVP